MKRFSLFILVCVMCFSALLTGCTESYVDIWEGIEGDEREYLMHDLYYGFNYTSIKLKKDNTVELFYNEVVYSSTETEEYEYPTYHVSNLGDEYADYNAEYKGYKVIYGTYKQTGDRLKVTFDSFTTYLRYDVSGEDAEAFKTAYIENNPDEVEIFTKGYVRGSNNMAGKELTLSVNNNECKPLSFKWSFDKDGETWTYYDSGEIKSYKSKRISDDSQKIVDFNVDASYTESVYADGVIIQSTEYDSNGNVHKYCTYDKGGKLETTSIYERNANGKPTTEKKYDSEDRLIIERTWKYDSDGKQISIEEWEYDSNGNLVAKREYDSKGMLLSETRYDD